MNRLLPQIRVAVALLLVGLGLVFGPSTAVAEAPWCAQPFGMHQAGELESAARGVAACDGRECLPDLARCCPGATGGACGMTALVAPDAPLPIVKARGAAWPAEQTSSFLGLSPQVRRRPPRLGA